MLLHLPVVAHELNITNQPEEIPIDETEVCFYVEAIDDEIVEDEETFYFAIETLDTRDTADGNSTVVVFDNDGTWCMHCTCSYVCMIKFCGLVSSVLTCMHRCEPCIQRTCASH